MSRLIDSATGDLHFEGYEDLLPEFENIPDVLLEAKFKLPKDVDISFVLNKHENKKDHAPLLPFLKSTDIYLSEFAESNKALRNFASGLAVGDKKSYKKYKELKSLGEFKGENSLHGAFFRSLYKYRPKVALFDPPEGHKAYDSVSGEQLTFAQLQYEDDLNLLTEPSYKELLERDKWCLKNMNSIVNDLMPYKSGERRKVLIGRGSYHLGLLRTLEYICEYDQSRARGSAVVSSIVFVEYAKQPIFDLVHYGRLK